MNRAQWGTLDRAGLVEHLIWAVRHSMGRSRQVPCSGGWLTRRLVGPLLLHGLIRIPRNVALPAHLRGQEITAREPGSLDTLEALCGEYLALVQADELNPASHPIFGPLDVDGWDRMHVLHFEHHCRQFGV